MCACILGCSTKICSALVQWQRGHKIVQPQHAHSLLQCKLLRMRFLYKLPPGQRTDINFILTGEAQAVQRHHQHDHIRHADINSCLMSRSTSTSASLCQLDRLSLHGPGLFSSDQYQLSTATQSLFAKSIIPAQVEMLWDWARQNKPLSHLASGLPVYLDQWLSCHKRKLKKPIFQCWVKFD